MAAVVRDSVAKGSPLAAIAAAGAQAPAGAIAWVRARAGILIPLLLSLLPVILFLPFVGEPLDADSGVYATVARGLLHGQIPYRDLFDHKQPLTYGWYALSYLLFGENDSSARILILFHLATTSLLVYWCGRLLFDSRGIGYLAALVFGLTPGLAMATDFGDARFLMLAPLTAGLLTYIMGYRSGLTRWYVVSGVLNGLATATLVLALFNLLSLLAFTVWRGLSRRESYRREVAALLAGAVVVLALAALPFVVTGSLGDFVYGNVVYNLGYAATPMLTTARLLELLALGFLVAGPFLAGAALGGWLLLRRGPEERGVLLGLWALASAAGFVSAGKLYDHYLIGLFPAVALLAAIALERLWVDWRAPAVKVCFLGTVPLIVLSVFFNLQPYLESAGVAHVASRYSREAYQRMVAV
ncbi:MAG TPA: glycosyltransferase family 39 protein, partial [Dehalococcoidia bacterium]|nr:glycosyltransferase family 39 protein [Dehalococcoidia bacterium]